MSRSTIFTTNTRTSISRPLTFHNDHHVEEDQKKKTTTETFDNVKIKTEQVGTSSIQNLTIYDSVAISGSLIITPNSNITVQIPNIAFCVETFTNSNMEIMDILNNKIFILTNNLMLPTDQQLNGIEIILYNKSASNIIITYVNGTTTIIPNGYNRFIYVYLLNAWLIF